MVELINESNKIRDHYREQATHHQHEIEEQTTRAERAERNPNPNPSSQLPQLIPIPSQYYLPFPTLPLQQPGQIPNNLQPNQHQQQYSNDQDFDGNTSNRHNHHNHNHNHNDNRYDRNNHNRKGSPRNPGEITHGEENRPNNDRSNRDNQIPPLRRSSSSDYERDEFATDTTDSKEFGFDRTQSHLAADHPARTLPPVDILLLIDASSSIGNNQFEQV
uniref:Uncharacterized protein n=1 Tax=Panagrolaimus superbus TaxID=310955 RepID=A0A914Y161_9BILA